MLMHLNLLTMVPSNVMCTLILEAWDFFKSLLAIVMLSSMAWTAGENAAAHLLVFPSTEKATKPPTAAPDGWAQDWVNGEGQSAHSFVKKVIESCLFHPLTLIHAFPSTFPYNRELNARTGSRKALELLPACKTTCRSDGTVGKMLFPPPSSLGFSFSPLPIQLLHQYWVLWGQMWADTSIKTRIKSIHVCHLSSKTQQKTCLGND